MREWYNKDMAVMIILSIVVLCALLFAYRPFAAWALKRHEVRGSYWLYVACVLYCVSWWLPSPLIHNQDMSTTTHIVGGGLFCGVLWLDIKTRFGITWHWLKQAMLLFALVSALGVVNELFELIGVEFGFLRIPLNDTNYDLMANTLGALAVFVIYYAAKAVKRDSRN